MTPEELNALSDEALFQRIDAIVNSRGSADYVPTNQHGLAPYITLKLLHRVHTRLAKAGVELNGKSALTNLLGWVVMELTFVAPPPDVRDVHTYGSRISQFLKRQYIDKSKELGSRAARKRPAAERAQQEAELDARCCSLTSAPSHIKRYDGPFPERGSSPTPFATRPCPHVPMSRSRLPEPLSLTESQETFTEKLQCAWQLGKERGERQATVAMAHAAEDRAAAVAAEKRAAAATDALAREAKEREKAEAKARRAEAERQAMEQQKIKTEAGACRHHWFGRHQRPPRRVMLWQLGLRSAPLPGHHYGGCLSPGARN